MGGEGGLRQRLQSCCRLIWAKGGGVRTPWLPQHGQLCPESLPEFLAEDLGVLALQRDFGG